ncbi:GAP family protein [Arthrobacter sp. GMC3]|uniref:GAP family protein n=1 Tax=Arthrobacter sp. GMC3 TaxID=2058894 RepID=UPI000CE40304|nr:GAP family protein [Arthrobacter sp. GMC3]
MGSVIGELLPLAIGIAVSPLPIIAAILLLLSPHARGTSFGFLIGWLLGIIVATVVFIFVATVLPETGTDGPQPIVGTLKIILGAALLVFAVRQFRAHPADGAEPQLPKWMSALNTMTAGRGTLLGLSLAALNPKNLVMAASAGITVGAVELDPGSTIVAVVLFTLIAGSTVGVPVIAYLTATERMSAPLATLRTWLVRNNSTVMAVLLLVLGVTQVGKGIGEFS